MAFELVQKPVGTLDLLLYLFRHGKGSVTSLISETGISRETFYNAVERLKALGFAYEDAQTGFPSYVYIGLTRTGEEFAMSLLKASEILTQTVDGLQGELDRLEKDANPATIPRRLEMLALLAERAFGSGEWDAAEQAATRAVELARSVRDPRGEAIARVSVGRIHQKRDRHDDATRELAEAIRIAEAAGLDAILSEAQYLLGSSQERRGEWAKALEAYRVAEERAGRANDALLAARAKQATARILGMRGDLEASLSLIREVVAALERLRAEGDLPRAYASLGSTLYHMDRDDEALEWFEKTVDAARRVGDSRTEGYGMNNAAARLIESKEAKDRRRAEVYLTRAREIFERLGERFGLGAVELNVGNLATAKGKWQDAEGAFDRALEIARETGNRWLEASVLFNRGKMWKQRDRAAEARSQLTAARDLFRGLGAEARAARCDALLRELSP